MFLRNFEKRPVITSLLPYHILPPFQATPTGRIKPSGLWTKWKYTAKSNVSTKTSMDQSDRGTQQHSDRNLSHCHDPTWQPVWLQISAASIWQLQISQNRMVLPATVLSILRRLSSQIRSNDLWHHCSSRMTTDIPEVSGQINKFDINPLKPSGH